MANDFPVLKVVRILDKITVVLAGTHLDKIPVNEHLVVLGRGPQIDELGGVPLIVEKAELTVTGNAVDYLVAQAPQRTYDEPVLSAFSGSPGTRKVTRREPLDVADADLSGNPASRPIAIGDPVIRRADYAAYVQLEKARAAANAR